ncbi:uncharacterized protein [Miscanthus floridulus]|uniref:uncharacterized protein n=1 Tax=Miscanthus floridulus TaxID=154761 RepID=UPI003458B6F5
MPRGGRSSGGGRRRSYSSAKIAKAPPPAPAAKGGGAPAPATTTGGGSVLGNIASAFAEGWVWSTSWAMANRAMDAVLGPRTFRIEHTAATTSATASGGGDDGASSPSNPCQIHAMAFQDCINQHGSDISRCQLYVNILNDCRRRGQVAAVETSG